MTKLKQTVFRKVKTIQDMKLNKKLIWRDQIQTSKPKTKNIVQFNIKVAVKNIERMLSKISVSVKKVQHKKSKGTIKTANDR